MKRVIIIGCSGAGKSTLARRLRDITDLPLFYLDSIYHRPDKTTLPREEFDRKLQNILSGERWIIDGNYARTLRMRLDDCDTAILLDYPTDVCLSGVEARIGQKRESMPWVEKEFDPEFRKRIEDFSATVLPNIYRTLEEYRDKVNIIIFRSRDEADEFLKHAAPLCQ